MGDADALELLDGAVTIRHLAYVDPPVERGGRIATPAGDLVQIANDVTIRLLVEVEFAHDGAIRGQHVHTDRDEHLYVGDGTLHATFRDTATGAEARRVLRRGDLVTVRAGCAHAYRAAGPARGIEFSDRPFTADGTSRVDLAPERSP